MDEISSILHRSLGMPLQGAGPSAGRIISIDIIEGLEKGCITITDKETGKKTSAQFPPGICCTGPCPCV
ncbi:MAG: hypothetical protein HKO81_00590 [Flavobacteriaceae bacterium]|nr:hypothetical protein [Flavobacteriaceae bacterium]